jgi:hypothetical protein
MSGESPGGRTEPQNPIINQSCKGAVTQSSDGKGSIEVGRNSPDSSDGNSSSGDDSRDETSAVSDSQLSPPSGDGSRKSIVVERNSSDSRNGNTGDYSTKENGDGKKVSRSMPSQSDVLLRMLTALEVKVDKAAAEGGEDKLKYETFLKMIRGDIDRFVKGGSKSPKDSLITAFFLDGVIAEKKIKFWFKKRGEGNAKPFKMNQNNFPENFACRSGHRRGDAKDFADYKNLLEEFFGDKFRVFMNKILQTSPPPQAEANGAPTSASADGNTSSESKKRKRQEGKHGSFLPFLAFSLRFPLNFSSFHSRAHCQLFPLTFFPLPSPLLFLFGNRCDRTL